MSVLASLLKEKIMREQLSEREVSRRTGLSNTTISNILNGEPVNINTLVAIADFLGVAPSSLLDSFLPKSNLESAISVIIERNPKLAHVILEAIKMIERGEIPPSELDELVRYMAFRLNINLEAENVTEQPDLLIQRSGQNN